MAGMHNPWPDPATEHVISGPLEQVQKHKKLDGDFMTEFKLR